MEGLIGDDGEGFHRLSASRDDAGRGNDLGHKRASGAAIHQGDAPRPLSEIVTNHPVSKSATILAKLPTAPRRGLDRIEAAIYIGIGLTKFDALVADGRMPGPRLIGSRKVWDIRRLDMAFDALPEEGVPEGGSWADR